MAGNGQLASAALGYVFGHRVRVDLVAQTVAMVAAAARDGVTLRITQAYRTYSEQVAIFRDRYTTTYLPGRPFRVWNQERWYQRPGTAVAAIPGTSNHGWGQAIDFATDSPGALAWLAANGARFGWSRPAWTYKAGTVEPWHHEATYVLVSNPIGGGGTVPNVPNLPPPAPIEEIDMPTADEIVDALLGRIVEGDGVRASVQSLLTGSRVDDHSVTLVPAIAKAVWDQRLTSTDGGLVASAEQFLVDTRIAAGVLSQPAALAALSDADVTRLARASADEQDRRDRERLAQ